MQIIKVDLDKDYTDVISEAVAILKQGGTIVYPTDTVYGLGCNAMDEFPIRRIFEIKERSSKPLPIIAKNMKWVEELVHLTDQHRKLCEKFWPGKYTLVLPKKEIIPPVVTTGLPSVGLRIADYEFTDKLLGAFGYPLVATAANVATQPATGNIDQVIAAFFYGARRPDLVIDAGVLPKSNPSVVIDCTTDEPKLLRVGASKPGEFLNLLKDIG